MLTDAKQEADAQGVPFEIWTYHEVRPTAEGWQIADRETGEVIRTISPALVINSTGAWGDLTLEELKVPAPELFGGTKGSHFVTHHRPLREAVGPQGVYAEAEDGRLVFILPVGTGIMVGTTDERFEGNPGEAVASEHELEYLLEMVNDLFPQVDLTRDDIDMHCAGVRPLPKADARTTAAISRDHSVHISQKNGATILTLVGGKLTTARAFGETVTDEVLARLGRLRTALTRDRVFPGGESYPEEDRLPLAWEQLARQHERPIEQIRAMWSLCGTETRDFLNQAQTPDKKPLEGTDLPRDFVRWIIDREWVRTLGDLVERRLMLLYHHPLSVECLKQLAELMVESGRLPPAETKATVESAVARLRSMYGKKIAGDDLAAIDVELGTDGKHLNQEAYAPRSPGHRD